MIETAILEHIAGLLGVPAYMEMPEELPEKFVILEKTGGGMADRVRSATFAIQSCSTARLSDAAALSKEAMSAMESSILLPQVASCRLNSGDYNFTDTEMKLYRYQAVYDIIYYD